MMKIHVGQRVATAVCVTAMGFAAFGCGIPVALAETPPNCTGADYAGITAGVAAGMSTYLFSHPDVNVYVTDLEKMPRDRSTLELANYEVANPQVRADIAAIRQPLVDFDARCGYASQGA